MDRQIKLSKLQKFILSEALDGYYRHEKWAQEAEAKERRLTVPKDPGEVEVLYTPRQGGKLYLSLPSGFGNPRNWPHASRKYILIVYFEFFTRQTARGSEVIDRKHCKKMYDRANASLSRALRRLEARRLLEPMQRRRGELRLTAEGIATAQKLHN